MSPRFRLCGTLSTVAALMASGPSYADEIGERIAAAAQARVGTTLLYDPSYRRLSYPMGDVPNDRGVCTDVVIRALRAVGLDLQSLVHRDMRKAFDAYPNRWGLSRPDPNIDHRRAPNLETYFTRSGYRLSPSDDREDYLPGDIVAWDLRSGSGVLPHIGVVTAERNAAGDLLVAHNIGSGVKLEDVLFDWPITGRYRIPSNASASSPSR